jgi:hypothetical protein
VTDKDNSETEIDSGTDTKDRNHLCLISFPYCAGKLTDVFEIPHPAYPHLATSRGAPIVFISFDFFIMLSIIYSVYYVNKIFNSRVKLC